MFIAKKTSILVARNQDWGLMDGDLKFSSRVQPQPPINSHHGFNSTSYLFLSVDWTLTWKLRGAECLCFIIAI